MPELRAPDRADLPALPELPGARIKDPCESCGKPIDPRWSICPYCETPQRRAAPPERRPPPKRRGKTADRRPCPEAPQRRSRAADAPVAQPPPRGRGRESRRASGDRRQPSSADPHRARADRRVEPLDAATAQRTTSQPPDAPRRWRTSRTLILIKPDAFERGLTGEILARFERKGLRITELRLLTRHEEIATATTPSTRRSRSSASWSRSSPAARWSPWCSRATRRSAARAADRRHEPDRGRDRARSAATTGSRSPSTSSTAPTPMSPPSARSDLVRLIAAPRLILASASPRRREILERLGVEFEAVVPDVEELARATRSGRGRERAPQGARGRSPRRGGATVLGVDTDVALDGACSARPTTSAGARAARGALRGAPTRCSAASSCSTPRCASPVERSAVARTEVTFNELDRRRSISISASGVARPRRRLRDPGPRARS